MNEQRMNSLGAMTRNNQSGFTLIELILVTVIIGILAGMVALNIGGTAETARKRAAMGDCATLETAVEMYLLDNPGPQARQMVTGNLGMLATPCGKFQKTYIKEDPIDPWGGTYDIRINPKNQTLQVFTTSAEGEEITRTWEKDLDSGVTAPE